MSRSIRRSPAARRYLVPLLATAAMTVAGLANSDRGFIPGFVPAAPAAATENHANGTGGTFTGATTARWSESFALGVPG